MSSIKLIGLLVAWVFRLLIYLESTKSEKSSDFIFRINFKRNEAHIRQDLENNKSPNLREKLDKLNMSPLCINLMMKLLTYDPNKRLSAKQALKHPLFYDMYKRDKRRMQF